MMVARLWLFDYCAYAGVGVGIFFLCFKLSWLKGEGDACV